MISEKVKQNIININSIEPISIKLIEKAETELNTVFDLDYKWIIQNFGFLDDFGNVISGIGAYDQFENVVFLNNNILLKHKSNIPKNFIAISYENSFNKILVLDNKTGKIYGYNNTLTKSELIFQSINDYLENVYCL